MAFSNKTGKCKICKEPATRKRGLASLCSSLECEVELGLQLLHKGKEAKRKQEVKNDRERKEKLKSLNDWKKELEAIVNKYVRLRDKDLPCISCDRSAYWDGQWHASHYKSVGSNSALRYNLWNIHKSCSICNNWKSGNIGEYTPRLIDKIGAERVEWLNNHPRIREYDVEWIKRAKSIFTRKIKRLEKRI